MANKKVLVFVLFVLLLGFLSGCAASKYVHKSFNPQEIDRITVLPFIDNRKDSNPEFNFNEMVQFGYESIIADLKFKKKYRTEFSSDIGTVSSYTSQNISSLISKSENRISFNPESVDSEWIKQLGPSKERWVLVPVLENLSHFNVMIQAGGKAEVSLYLFDKKTGELNCGCNAKGRLGGGILMYGIMKMATSEKNFFEKAAIESSAIKCIDMMPKRKGPYLLPD